MEKLYKGKILIVDDDAMNVELLVETLKPLEYEILAYSDPIKALKDLQTTKIDLVLLDIVMPQICGFEFSEKFICTHPTTPIIYVSAYSENENKIRGYNLGSFAYIEKPFDIKTTRAQVQSVLKLKKMQDELMQQKEKLETIYEFSNDEIILTDLNFNIVSQNNKILNNPIYISKSFLEILAINEQNEAITTVQNFVNSDLKSVSFRFIVEENKYTKTNISKICSQKTHSGYLILMNDITEEIQIEKQREKFIETLTHDLKTPVRAEERALQLLYDGSFGELQTQQKDMVKEILNSSKYMIRMTDNILTKYKIDNHNLSLTKTAHSLRKSVEYCISKLSYLLETTNQTIKIINNSDDDVFCYDEQEIKKVLFNIIANASEYSPKNSTIYVQIFKDNEDKITIQIKDEGIGISQEKLNSYFLDNEENEKRFKKVGSGLGLFISKKIIDAHLGSIEVTSNENGGTIFSITLPFEKSSKYQEIATN